MAELAIGMAIAGSAVSSVGSIMAGREKSAAAAFEAEQMRTQAQMARTAAAQEEAQRRETLTSNIETIQAIQAGRGIGSGPTSGAILTSYIEDAERDTRIAKVNMLSKADLYRRGAEMADRKSKYSLLAGFMEAGSTLLSTGGKVAGGYYGPSMTRTL